MELHRQAMRLCRLKHAFNLRCRKTDRLAKAINCIGQPSLRRRRNDRIAHMVDIAIGIARKFRRQGMGGEQAWS